MIEIDNLTLEELKTEYLKQMEIKKSMTEQQNNLKEELRTLRSEAENTSATVQALKEKSDKENEQKLLDKVKSMNVQEKFAKDLISKAGLSLDMDEKEFAEATAKTLETYQEYKAMPESVKLGSANIENEPKVSFRDKYLAQINEKKKNPY